jgi:hypothetical protein
MANSECIRLLTPTFRVSFPNVFVKRVFQGEKSGRYTCVALFSGFEVKDGRTIIKARMSWYEKDQAKWSARDWFSRRQDPLYNEQVRQRGLR